MGEAVSLPGQARREPGGGEEQKLQTQGSLSPFSKALFTLEASFRAPFSRAYFLAVYFLRAPPLPSQIQH